MIHKQDNDDKFKELREEVFPALEKVEAELGPKMYNRIRELLGKGQMSKHGRRDGIKL